MKQNQGLSPPPNTCNVGRNLKSITYLMLIWQTTKNYIHAQKQC